VKKHNRVDFKPYLWLAVGLAAWWLLPTAFRRILRDAVFYEFQAPVLSAESHLHDLQVYWEKRSHSSAELVSANVAQARIIAGQAAENRRLQTLSTENVRLREALRQDERTNYRTLVARVVRRDINTWWKKIIVRRGAVDGVRLGSPVVSGDNVIGRVTRVHRHSSEVQLISDPDFRASVNVEGSNKYVAVYQGIAGRPFDPPKGVITHLSVDFPEADGGVTVYTSGSGGIFPPALVLGKISGQLTATSDGLFRTGDVALHQQLHALEEATILVPTAADFAAEEFFKK
jgi:rod shape-determining protein MreC